MHDGRHDNHDDGDSDGEALEALRRDARPRRARSDGRARRGVRLLGPNGAGKTTTIRLLLGLHRPSTGQAELFGVDAWRNQVAAHKCVAYVSAEPNLWPTLTGAETLEFLARVRGAADAVYRDVLVERFQLDADKKVRALSLGNRQKVQLIAAFASRADC